MNTVKIRFNQLPKKMKWVLLIPIGIISLLLLVAPISKDGDIWFLLSTGREICNNGFPIKEILTIHKDFDIIVQQWLTDVIFYKLYISIGDIGLKIITCLCSLYMSMMILKTSLKISKNFFISYMSTFLSVFILNQTFFYARPQIFSLCLFITEIYFLESYMEKSNWRFLIPIPIISLMLINFHAAMWPILFVIMVPYIFDLFNVDFKIIKFQGANKLPFIITFISSFIMGFINPYGIKSMLYFFNSVGVSEINTLISEMRPLALYEFGYITLILVVIFSICINFRFKNGRSISKIRYILLMLGFGFASFLAMKNLTLFVICAPCTVAYCLKEINPIITYNKKLSFSFANKMNHDVLIFFIVVLSFISLVFLSTNPYNSNMEKVSNYIVENYTEKENLKIFTGLNKGSYLEYLGYHPYIDSRVEVFLKKNNHKEDIFKEYYKLQNGFLNYGDFLDKYTFDLILVDKEDTLYYQIDNNKQYKIVYSDDNFKLFEHNKKVTAD